MLNVFDKIFLYLLKKIFLGLLKIYYKRKSAITCSSFILAFFNTSLAMLRLLGSSKTKINLSHNFKFLDIMKNVNP